MEWITTSFLNNSFNLDELQHLKTSLYNYEILKSKNKLIGKDKDINNISGLHGYKFKVGLLDILSKPEYNENIVKSRSDVKNEKRVIYESDNLLIISPQTKEAAIYYGKNTKWCTSGLKDNLFDDYNKKGPLYIVITGDVKKFQFQEKDFSYMDELDEPIDMVSLFTTYPELKTVVKQIPEIYFIHDISIYDYIQHCIYDDYEDPKVDCTVDKINELIKNNNFNVDIEYNSPEYGLATLLWRAVYVDNLDIAKILIANGADLDYTTGGDKSYLMLVADIGSVDMANLLLESTIDKNNINLQNVEGWTALMYAVFNNRLQMCEFLLKRCVLYIDTSLQNNQGDTALILSVRINNNDIAKLLIDAMYNYNETDHMGNSALIIAVENKYTEIVKELVRVHANTFIINKDHNTAFTIAGKKNYKKILKILENKDGLPDMYNNLNTYIMDYMENNDSQNLDNDSQNLEISPSFLNALCISNIIFINDYNNITVCKNYNNNTDVIYSAIDYLKLDNFFVTRFEFPDTQNTSVRLCLPREDFIPYMKNNVLANIDVGPDIGPDIGDEMFYSIPSVTGICGNIGEFASVDEYTYWVINQIQYPYGITVFTLHKPEIKRLINISTKQEQLQTVWSLKTKDILIKKD